MALADNKAKIQALLAGINALPDEGNGGVELPTLSNPAVAVDIVVGKEAIDGEGNVLTGTNPYVKTATDEVVADQTDLITQIKTALDGKTAGGGTAQPQYASGTQTLATNRNGFVVNGLSFKPTRFVIEYEYTATGIEHSNISAGRVAVCSASYPSDVEGEAFVTLADSVETWSNKTTAIVTEDGFSIPYYAGNIEFVDSTMQMGATYKWHAWRD